MSDADFWKNLIKEHENHVNTNETVRLKIESAMTNYLNSVGETEDSIVTYTSKSHIVELDYYGDLFNLEQIGEFCDVFGLDILINNRTVIENYEDNSTTVENNFLFKVKGVDNNV